jgi:hypothetical protein
MKDACWNLFESTIVTASNFEYTLKIVALSRIKAREKLQEDLDKYDPSAKIKSLELIDNAVIVGD